MSQRLVLIFGLLSYRSDLDKINT